MAEVAAVAADMRPEAATAALRPWVTRLRETTPPSRDTAHRSSSRDTVVDTPSSSRDMAHRSRVCLALLVYRGRNYETDMTQDTSRSSPTPTPTSSRPLLRAVTVVAVGTNRDDNGK